MCLTSVPLSGLNRIVKRAFTASDDRRGFASLITRKRHSCRDQRSILGDNHRTYRKHSIVRRSHQRRAHLIAQWIQHWMNLESIDNSSTIQSTVPVMHSVRDSILRILRKRSSNESSLAMLSVLRPFVPEIRSIDHVSPYSSTYRNRVHRRGHHSEHIRNQSVSSLQSTLRSENRSEISFFRGWIHWENHVTNETSEDLTKKRQ